MDMDLVGVAELTRMDTFKCLDFRGACVGSSEGPARIGTQCPWLSPQGHPTHFSQGGECSGGRRLNHKEEMKQDKPPHYWSVSFCPSLSPSSFFPLLSFALVSLLFPSLFFSASSPGFISCSLIFAFSFTFPASCGCAEIDDRLKGLPQGHCSGEGRGG